MAAPTKDTSYILGLVLDFETGGLEPQKSAITQMAVHAHRLDTFERLGTYVAYILPYNRRDVKGVASKRKVLKSKFDRPEENPMEYSDRAMAVTGITMDLLEDEGKPIDDAAMEMLAFIEAHTCPKTPLNKKPVIIGQNIAFDEGFLCQMFEYAGLMKELKKAVRGKEDFYGNWHPLMIDTLLLGQLAFCTTGIPNYKLSTMAEALGVDLNDAHEADADVMATANICAVLSRRMRSEGGGTEDVHMSKTEKTRPHFKI